MKKVFYYPPADKQGRYPNPYSTNFKESINKHCNLLGKDDFQKGLKSFSLLKYAFSADVFILNWIESVPHLSFGLIQSFITFISLGILKLRGGKIIWMLHNIFPHQGETAMTKLISNFLYKHSNAIVTHSNVAKEYALKRSNNVHYVCHPVMKYETVDIVKKIEDIDVFIWGAIVPYKGIYEFISNQSVQSSRLSIKIIGFCNDELLDNKIKSCTNEFISYENRKADYSEIAAYCKSSKYTLFPYIGECVSSSGALIDTISFGGTAIGPSIGAFLDLAQEKVCITYNNDQELLKILNSKRVFMDKTQIEEFISLHSWEKFGIYISKLIYTL